MRTCPFCGSQVSADDVTDAQDDGNVEGWAAMCPGCHATGPIAPTRDDAVRRWDGNRGIGLVRDGCGCSLVGHEHRVAPWMPVVSYPVLPPSLRVLRLEIRWRACVDCMKSLPIAFFRGPELDALAQRAASHAGGLQIDGSRAELLWMPFAESSLAIRPLRT